MEIIDLPADHPRWEQALPVLQELRTTRTAEELRTVITEGADQGLRFLGAFDAGACLGVAGWRLMISTSALRKLYVDDLVTHSDARSTGVGAILLSELRKRARDLDCTALELDSGVQRHGAHRFYLRERMDITAHHFTQQL